MDTNQTGVDGLAGMGKPSSPCPKRAREHWRVRLGRSHPASWPSLPPLLLPLHLPPPDPVPEAAAYSTRPPGKAFKCPMQQNAGEEVSADLAGKREWDKTAGELLPGKEC